MIFLAMADVVAEGEDRVEIEAGRNARRRRRQIAAGGCPSSQARWASSWTVPVGVVAARSGLDQRQQDAFGEKRAAVGSARGS